MLETNDVASKAEAEIAWVVSWYLLGRHVNLSTVSTGARPINRLIVFVVIFVGIKVTATVHGEVRIILARHCLFGIFYSCLGCYTTRHMMLFQNWLGSFDGMIDWLQVFFI